MRFAMSGMAVALAIVIGAAAPAQAQLRETFAGSYLMAQHAIATRDTVAAARYLNQALHRDPGNGPLMEQTLVFQLAAGDIAGAMRVAERLARLAPDHRMAQTVLAVRDIRRGGFEALRERIAGHPDGFHPLTGGLLAAWGAMGQGDTDAALATLAEIGDSGLLGAFAGFHEGLVLMLADDPEGAVDAFERVRSVLGARSARIIEAEAAALRALGRDDEALAIYEEADRGRLPDAGLTAAKVRLADGLQALPLVATVEEGAAEALFGLAGLLSGEEDSRIAIAHARLALHLRPDLEAATLMIAGLFVADEQPGLAAATFAGIAEDSPNRLRADIGRAEALQALDRTEEAEDLLRRLIAAKPGIAEPHLALGDLLRRERDWEPCAEAYGTAIDLLAADDRATWGLYYHRGICFERAGLWDDAEADFLKALELEPDQPLVLNYLGYSWVEQRRNLDKAKAMIRLAVEQRPDDGYITDSLGWVLYRMGDFEGAVEWLEKAVSLAPHDPVINDHLGDALWKVGRRHEARFQWRRARGLDPEPDDLARIKRKLEVGLDLVLDEERAAAERLANPAEPLPVTTPNDG